MRKTKFENAKTRRAFGFPILLLFAFRILFSAFPISSRFVIMSRVTSSPGSGNFAGRRIRTQVARRKFEFRPPWVSTIDGDDLL